MISDPGSQLVATAAAAGHRIIPLPGPSAAVAAVVASALPSGDFRFIGFLPPKTAARRKSLEAIKGESSHTDRSHSSSPDAQPYANWQNRNYCRKVEETQQNQLRRNPSHFQIEMDKWDCDAEVSRTIILLSEMPNRLHSYGNAHSNVDFLLCRWQCHTGVLCAAARLAGGAAGCGGHFGPSPPLHCSTGND